LQNKNEILQNQAPMLIIKKICKKRKRNSPQKTSTKTGIQGTKKRWKGKQNVNQKVKSNNHPFKTNKRFQIRFGPKHVGYSQPSLAGGKLPDFRSNSFSVGWPSVG